MLGYLVERLLITLISFFVWNLSEWVIFELVDRLGRNNRSCDDAMIAIRGGQECLLDSFSDFCDDYVGGGMPAATSTLCSFWIDNILDAFRIFIIHIVVDES